MFKVNKVNKEFEFEFERSRRRSRSNYEERHYYVLTNLEYCKVIEIL